MMLDKRPPDTPSSPDDPDPLLSVRDLSVHFYTNRGVGKAVDGVTFDLARGQTMGLVGESGSGKTITVMSIIGLHPKPAARIMGGEILFGGKDLLNVSPREMRQIRGKHIAMVLQDPMTALNPVFTVRNQLFESLRLHQNLSGDRLGDRAIELLRTLRIAAPDERLGSYPHMFSGGMRQRIVGAIAIAGAPEVLIADEPTTSLDVTVEAAYLALLRDLQQATGLSIIYISHDLSVIARMCDRVTVMYAGKAVESATAEEIFKHPAHPYTKALLNAIPDVRRKPERLTSIEGQPPSIYDLSSGCPFAQRCPVVRPICSTEFPASVEVGPSHNTACWRYL